MVAGGDHRARGPPGRLAYQTDDGFLSVLVARGGAGWREGAGL